MYILGIMKMQTPVNEDAEIVRRAAASIEGRTHIYTCTALFDAGASLPLQYAWERFCRRPRWQFWHRCTFPDWWNKDYSDANSDATQQARAAALRKFAIYLETST